MSDAERPKAKQQDPEVASNADEDPGYESRSRSQSRRRRRQNQRQRQAQSKAQAGNAKAESQAMTKVDEQEEPQEQQAQQEERHPDWPYAPRDQWLDNPATADTTEAQPFSRIKPASQSMDGPVTYARMMRGEIPWRGAPPRQPYETTQGVDAKAGKDPMDQDGLKLRIELNLDIEIELKASIHGDLTLALL